MIHRGSSVAYEGLDELSASQILCCHCNLLLLFVFKESVYQVIRYELVWRAEVSNQQSVSTGTMPANALLAPISSLRADRTLHFGHHKQRSRHQALICAVARPSTAPPAGTQLSSHGNVVVVGGGWAGMHLYL